MTIGIWKQGYQRSENGWPMVDTAELDYGPVPGTGFNLGVRKGEPNAILKALIWRLDKIEPMIVSQIGCYTGTNTMPNSNHNSATAVDYNWNRHPWHKANTWANRAAVSAIVADFRGTVEWGGYWSTSYLDEMHFEMHFGPGHQGTIDLARQLWSEGLWGIFKPGAPPATGPNNPPVLPTDFLLTIGSTGTPVLALQRGMNKVFRSYKAMPLAEDNIYGPNTSAAVAEFQRRATEFKLSVDGDVGPLTRKALAAYGVMI